ncbi:hypothetical protein [Cupriavidus taiwanensis]|uniref:hypothetical protein n=1 Tax=Cupriavidus taiwanensis TaxID=164546 RepID=UPI0011C0612C|nr:hypothetical protein [Cupriavidus taiwanensis]
MATTNTDSPQQTANLTGKAIDGYLIGAKVCLDVNGNDSCDPGEPSTTTDENGNYGLVADASATGKTLLVVIDTNTRDKSRPGYTFPAGFVLSGIVDGATGQHITPITTLVRSQVQSGKSQAAAEQAVVSLLGGKINIKDDYIANGDGRASAFAASVVDKVVEFAKAGRGDADTVRAVMNAIATKGSVTAVSQADVDAARAKPFYTADVDAQALLAEPAYAYAGERGDFATLPPKPIMVRQALSLSGQVLQTAMEELGLQASNWVASPAGASGVAHIYGHYALKSDGGWSPFIPASGIESKLAVQAFSGNVVTTTDSNTGIGTRLEFRRTVLDGKALINAMPVSTSSDVLTAMPGAFGAGTTGYAVIRSRDLDAVTLPASAQCSSANPIIEDGVEQCPLLGTPTQQYASVQDVLTVPPVPFLGIGYLRFGAGDQVVVYDGNDANHVLLDSSKIRWSLYARNANVMVFDVAYADIAHFPSLDSQYGDLIKAGGKAVIALHNGHLRFGMLLPAGMETTTVLLKSSAFDHLTRAIKSALAQ